MAGEDDRRFGVVIFDEPDDPGAGWASIADERRPQSTRVGGPNELATDTIWWTNVTYANFFKGDAQTWRNPNLRHDKYLPLGHQDVLKEWGYDPTSVDADFTATFCAQAFDRIMRIAWTMLRDANPKQRLPQAFQGKTMRDDLRTLIPELEYPRLEAAEALKSGQAWEEYTATGARGPKGGKWVVLRRPRLAYAMEMLQTPVPKGPYILKKRGEIGKMQPNPVEHVRKMATPAIVEVTVNKIQPEVAPIYGFGAATDRDKRTTRSWVAHPEFQILSRVADVSVRSMWQGDAYWPLVPAMPEPARAFLQDRFSDLSWSAGIVAESLWRAACLPEDKSKAGPQREGDPKANTSWQGLWIRAADKGAMFGASMRLTEMGHAVVSYGLGWTRAQVSEEDIPNLIRDGLSMGLLPNLLDIPVNFHSLADGAVTWGGDKRSEYLATVMAAKSSKALWGFDRLPLLPTGAERKVKMGQIVTANQPPQQGAARRSA